MPYHDDLTAAQARIAALEEEVRRLKGCKSKWHFQPHPDLKACPDCGGTNYFHPGGLNKPGLWKRLFGQKGPIIQAGGNVTIRSGAGGKIKGMACPDLPPEPPPPKLIPPPGGTGVQPPPPTRHEVAHERLNAGHEAIEAKLEYIVAKLELLELRTHHLKEGVHVRMVTGR